jgi:hypothetical protein
VPASCASQQIEGEKNACGSILPEAQNMEDR